MKKWPSVLSRLYCLFLVTVGWYIFSYPDITSGLGYLRAMFGLAGGGFAGGETVYLLLNHAVLFVFLIIGSTDLPARAGRHILSLVRKDVPAILIRGGFLAAVFLLSVAYLVDASYNPFLYFRF